MFLHIGQEKMVPLKKVIAILDPKIYPLEEWQEDSAIILSDEGVFSSSISVSTLVSRIGEKYRE